jgi:hypothetical protein
MILAEYVLNRCILVPVMYYDILRLNIVLVGASHSHLRIPIVAMQLLMVVHK